MSNDLPLTNFEQLMLHKDSSAYPSSCFLRLRFYGRLNRTAFERAARLVIKRHPLLQATVVKTKGGYRWNVVDADPEISWCEDPQCVEPPAVRQDLEQRCGLTLAVAVSSHNSAVRIQFHHACCDGLAIYQVAHELLIAYAAIVTEGSRNPTSNALPELDESLLKARNDLGLRGIEFFRTMVRQSVGLLGVVQYAIRSPVPLLRHDAFERNQPTPATYPGLVARHFKKEASTKFRSTVPAEFTTNDVLTCLLFEAMHEFRADCRQSDQHSWLRLMVPFSLRKRPHYKCPAANIVSTVFLDRRGRDIDDPIALRHSILAEFERIKRFKLGYTFVYSLMAARLLPNGLKKTAEPAKCNTSAVFTNLGRVFKRSPLPVEDGKLKCGDVILEATEAAAPIGKNVCTAFSASWYAGQLSITLHYDPRVIDSATAQRLLDMFCRRIENNAAGSPLSSITTVPR